MTEAQRTEAFGDEAYGEESNAAQQNLELEAGESSSERAELDGPPPRRRLDEVDGEEESESDDFESDEDKPLDERGYWGEDEEDDDPGTFIESADGEGPTISEEDEFAPSFSADDDDEEPPATDYAAAASGPPPPDPVDGPGTNAVAPKAKKARKPKAVKAIAAALGVDEDDSDDEDIEAKARDPSRGDPAFGVVSQLARGGAEQAH